MKGRQRLAPLICASLMVALSSCRAEPPPITETYMQYLGKRAASGDRKAMQSIVAAHHQLYDGIDWNDNSLLCANCQLMTAAFTPMGQESARGSKTAKDALKFFVGKEDIRVFAADPLGVAAAAGDKEALSLLLDYDRTGFLESTVVSSLVPTASSNVTEAVEFMFRVLEDPNANAIRHFAVSGLEGAARAGNEKAKEAVLRYRVEALRERPDRDRLIALERIDASVAREQAHLLFANASTSRQYKYALGQYLVRTQMPDGGRKITDPAGFISEYRAFLIGAILDGGEQEILNQKEFGLTSAVGEYCRIAAGDQGGPEPVLFADVQDPRVIPVLLKCLRAPRYDGELWVRFPVNVPRNTIPLALARQQAVEAIPLLQEIAKTHEDPNFRKTALFALDVLIPLVEARQTKKDSANQVPEDTTRKLADPQH